MGGSFKRVRRKAELLANAGTTAEGAQDEVVRSLAQGLVAGAWTKAHHIASGGERGGSAGAVLAVRRTRRATPSTAIWLTPCELFGELI